MSHVEKTQLLAWGIAALLLLGAEMITFSFVSIYFALGAAAAGVTVFLTDNVLIQVVVFSIVSMLTLFGTRKFVNGLAQMRSVPGARCSRNYCSAD